MWKQYFIYKDSLYDWPTQAKSFCTWSIVFTYNCFSYLIVSYQTFMTSQFGNPVMKVWSPTDTKSGLMHFKFSRLTSRLSSTQSQYIHLCIPTFYCQYILWYNILQLIPYLHILSLLWPLAWWPIPTALRSDLTLSMTLKPQVLLVRTPPLMSWYPTIQIYQWVISHTRCPLCWSLYSCIPSGNLSTCTHLRLPHKLIPLLMRQRHLWCDLQVVHRIIKGERLLSRMSSWIDHIWLIWWCLRFRLPAIPVNFCFLWCISEAR